MPTIFGDTLLGWAVRIALAVLAFFLVTWLFPKFMTAVHLAPPDPITFLLAIALLVLLFPVLSHR